MEIILLIYIVITIVFYINLMLSLFVLDCVKQSISVRERTKLTEKIKKIEAIKKFTAIWPYALYIIIKK